ncbi:hypothetical protein IG631_02770 [Alternaria alternata]|nr:hypothetical protein IG631_02770 [Alternaria alternata]
MSNAQIANGSARIGNSLYNGYASASSSSDLRRNATVHTRHPPQLPPITQASPIDMAVNDPGSAQRRRNPDWADFYRNGIPKEVIVIDDDDDDDAQLPPPRQQPPSSRGTATNPAARHTDKKRKTTASTAYDPVYNQHTSYSTTQTPYYDSPNHSLSTDRTTSALNTTAPTSLGSQVSNGHHISPLENSAAGQKRKRTRAVVQDEAKQAKRRELDNDDPFSLYQPPPNPVIKAKDVYVQVVQDSNGFVPFPSSHIQKFAKQLFTSVAFLHDLNLIHTDLKPENILLVNNNYQTFTYNRTVPSSSTTVNRTARHRKVLLDPEIRLIDFGSATFNDEYHSSVVSTRHYRAPEIILNLGWSFPCDIWSIGCILVEFFTGDALFQTHDNLEHLAMMEAVCSGKIDRDIVRAVYKQDRGSSRNSSSSFSAARYFKNYKLDYPNADTNKASKKYVKAMKKLPETIPAHTDFNRQFLDLLRRIFVYDPKKRITAKEALQHPWFKESLMDDGTEAHKIRLEREKKARRAEEERRFREQTQRAY